MKISIFNYGVGNIFSLKSALRKLGVESELITPAEIKNIKNGLILPGVGNFSAAIEKIEPHKDDILDIIHSGIPVLGICLGMQILFLESEEGNKKGLSIFPANIVRFPDNLKIPHMGWNTIKMIKFDQLIEGLENKSYVYFAHSFYPKFLKKDYIISKTSYGLSFASIIVNENVRGTQFHPEKSGNIGQRILKNYIKLIKR